jgi:hypothetical protein
LVEEEKRLRNLKTIIPLVVILLALGGIATWDEWQTKKEKQEEEGKNKLLSLNPEDVVGIEWTEANNETFTPFKLVRSEGGWRITAPLDAPADPEAVGNTLNAIKDYKYEEVVSESSDQWEEFGLKNGGVRTVVLTLKDGEGQRELSIVLGTKAPVGYSVYSRTTESDKSYIGSQYLDTATQKSLNDFRQKKFVEINVSDLKSLTINSPGSDEISIDAVDGGYELKTPTAGKADKQEVESFVRSINEIRATEFADDPDQKTLFLAIQRQDNQRRVSWTNGSDKTHTLIINDYEGGFWAMLEGEELAYKINDDFKTRLDKKAIDFMDRRVFQFDSGKVKKFTLNGETYIYAKDDWYPEGQVSKGEEPDASMTLNPDAVPAEFVRSLLVDLEFAKTDSFLKKEDQEAKDSFAKDPVYHYVLGMSDNESPIDIKVWESPTEGKYLITHSGSDEIYRVSKTIIDSNLKSGQESPQEDMEINFEGLEEEDAG